MEHTFQLNRYQTSPLQEILNPKARKRRMLVNFSPIFSFDLTTCFFQNKRSELKFLTSGVWYSKQSKSVLSLLIIFLWTFANNLRGRILIWSCCLSSFFMHVLAQPLSDTSITRNSQSKSKEMSNAGKFFSYFQSRFNNMFFSKQKKMC